MIELTRVIENQSSLSSYRATQNAALAAQLELLIELTKPHNPFADWDPLIATPFRYNPPHPQARFRPAYGKNVFYASLIAETALYEHAFHFMKQRRHLKIKSDTGIRTIFSVNGNNQHAIKIHHLPNRANIMDKNDYSASQQFVISNPNVRFIIYPSCRDPSEHENAAVLDINYLSKSIKSESTIKFFYDNQQQQIHWLDYYLRIKWYEVC